MFSLLYLSKGVDTVYWGREEWLVSYAEVKYGNFPPHLH